MATARPPLPIADVVDARRSHLFHPERVPVAVADAPPWPGYAPTDPRCAWHLASLCHAAYHEPEAAGAAARALGWEPERRIERDGIRADLLQRDGERLLCCCGTRARELRNLRHDGDAIAVDHPCAGRAHRGFLAAWVAIADALRDQPPTWATGHSLGAAVALLAACELPAVGAVGFGCPRVGDRAFATAIGPRVVRYQVTADVVGHLPLQRQGYRHAGRLLLLDRGELITDPSPGELAHRRRRGQLRYARALPWLRPSALWFRELADHAVHGYAALLRAQVQQPT